MPYGELLRALEAEVDAQCRAEEERSRREVEAILAEGRRESADARDAALARARADAAALGVSLAVLLHAVNFTLGLASPLIASLRLHYVEFFEKFYEGGGKPYRPFALQGS